MRYERAREKGGREGEGGVRASDREEERARGEGESCSAPVQTADSVEAGKDGRRLAVRGERAVERSVERRRVALGRRKSPEADGAVADRADDGLDEEQEADLVDRDAAHCRERKDESARARVRGEHRGARRRTRRLDRPVQEEAAQLLRRDAEVGGQGVVDAQVRGPDGAQELGGHGARKVGLNGELRQDDVSIIKGSAEREGERGRTQRSERMQRTRMAGKLPHGPSDALARTGNETCIKDPILPFTAMMMPHRRKPKNVIGMASRAVMPMAMREAPSDHCEREDEDVGQGMSQLAQD